MKPASGLHPGPLRVTSLFKHLPHHCAWAQGDKLLYHLLKLLRVRTRSMWEIRGSIVTLWALAVPRLVGRTTITSKPREGTVDQKERIRHESGKKDLVKHKMPHETGCVECWGNVEGPRLAGEGSGRLIIGETSQLRLGPHGDKCTQAVL